MWGTAISSNVPAINKKFYFNCCPIADNCCSQKKLLADAAAFFLTSRDVRLAIAAAAALVGAAAASVVRHGGVSGLRTAVLHEGDFFGQEETLWGRYQSDGVSKGVSVSQYFEANGIPYHVFEKWYKKRFRQPDVVDCVVDGMPDDGKSSCASPSSFRRDMQADEEDRT